MDEHKKFHFKVDAVIVAVDLEDALYQITRHFLDRLADVRS